MGCFSGDDRIHDENCGLHKRRTCTDTICLALFTLFWGFLIFIAIMAFILGDPLRLIHGTDSFGNVCGRKNNRIDDNIIYSGLDMSERKYVFFLNQDDLKNSLSICVKQCPNRTLDNEGDVELFFQTTGSSLCRYDYEFRKNRSPSEARAFADDTKNHVGPCPTYPVYASKPLLNRCVPKNIYSLGSKVVASVYGYFNSFDTFKQVVADLMVSYQEVLIMTAVSIVLSLKVVFLIHFFAHIISLILLICVSVSMVILTGIFWWTWIDIKYKLDYNMSRLFPVLDESFRNERTFLALSIITIIITVILILICLVMRKRVKLVVALFEEAGACIRAMPGLLFQPFWTFLVLSMFVIFWLAVILAIATADYGSKKDTQLALKARRPANSDPLLYSDQNNLNNPSIGMTPRDLAFGQSDISILSSIKFDRPTWIKYMWWYALIAFVWSCEFILGCQQMVIAGAVGSWYFCRDRSNLPCPVGRSIRRLVLFHMGSVAFGSFLITLLKIPRIILAYTEEKLKQYEDYAVVRGMLRCCGCCLWMLENFLQYLNRNAYSVTAIRGTSFCTSAQIAFTTIASNALRVATINSVGDFILFLGKCCVTAITAILTTLLLKVRYPQSVFHESLLSANNLTFLKDIYPIPSERPHKFLTISLPSSFLSSSNSSLINGDQTDDSIHFYAVPLILVCVLSYFVAHCILSVYEVSTLSCLTINDLTCDCVVSVKLTDGHRHPFPLFL